MMGFLVIVAYYLVRVYSFIFVVYALLSFFPSAYQTWFGRMILQTVRPILLPLSKLPLQFGGFDWTILVLLIACDFLSSWLFHLAQLLG
ncbi:YggT family protein [Streptococcus himalayensis]|uniref:YggT family protein n=1 Tax=Streptococcus himalayensis TaxID=1888195 RepID=A0A917A8Z7_9STRE|nr:YggT family protein [Streptococcus himalayensis]GGE34216.1 hypothetical protein GCM10011510_14490 [Streptococcus himalayensis]